MNKWLEGFAYRDKIQWSTFALAALGSLAIAFITTGFQSVKAAIANPVDSLRAE
jgi:putative ABC transport system permease protein